MKKSVFLLSLSRYPAVVTVLEIIQKSTAFLEKKGVESPRLQSELLLAHLLKMPRLKLYLNHDRPVAEPEVEAMRQIVVQRGNRVPLQHLLGTVSFAGVEICVNKHALIPRPETELLAELALKKLTAMAHSPRTVLDIGTGTGCLPVYLARHCQEARFVAVDISLDALNLARCNAEKQEVSERIQFYHGDLFAPLPDGDCFDLVLSNPPYIPTTEIETLEVEVRDHDPRLALDGGGDGLDFYRRLACETAHHLKPEGQLLMECGAGQGADIERIFSEHTLWKECQVIKDFNGLDRIVEVSREK